MLSILILNFLPKHKIHPLPYLSPHTGYGKLKMNAGNLAQNGTDVNPLPSNYTILELLLSFVLIYTLILILTHINS